MSRERKKYAIRATNRPAKNDVLSTTVVVVNELGKTGYCYINFDADFVEAVGSALPRGVSGEDQAFISVSFYAPTKVWLVTANYLDGSSTTLLWKTPQRPSWLNFFTTSLSHGYPNQEKRRRGRPRKGSDCASGGETHRLRPADAEAALA